MGESSKRKKERRREAPKPTSKLSPLPTPTDSAVADKQRAFCKKLVEDMLEDDSSLSFARPVRELWDISQLSGYFEKIKEPMDLGTVQKNLESKTQFLNDDTALFDPNAFREKIRLVFWNAMDFNGKGTDLYRLANKFLQFVDGKVTDLPGLHHSDGNQGATTSTTATKLDPEVKTKDKESKQKGTPPPSAQKANQSASADQPDEDIKDAQPEANANNNDSGAEEESEKLNRQITALEKHKSRAKANLAELELMRNVPLSHQENAKLRDDIESLPWEKAKKVVKILRKYVDEALADINEEDPEFVTLELTVVEPHLLRDIEAMIRPDPRQEEEKRKIANLDDEITSLKRKLKKASSTDTSSRKKQRRRR